VNSIPFSTSFHKAMVRVMTNSILALLLSAGGVTGNVFLGAHPRTEHTTVTRASVEHALALELASLASPQAGYGRPSSFIEEVRPLFDALPKNQHGKLEPSVVRYALHRYFAQKHGWHLKGLEAAGASWNQTSPLSIAKEQIPALIQDLFEQRVHGEGLDLNELAAFAATMSDLVRAEVASDVQHIYETRVGDSSSLSRGQFDKQVLEVFLVAFVNGFHSETWEYAQDKSEVEETFVGWEDLVMWAGDLHRSFDFFQRSRRNPFVESRAFEDDVDFMVELVQKFGNFQKAECRNLKEELMKLEEHGSGRVRLSSFWSGARDDTWPFRESLQYLRDLGALDETHPQMPTVIIANYLHGKSNCMDPSDFYDVCCIDECEGLMAEVERRVAGPLSSPGSLAEIVSSLASDTVEAPRNLSSVQLGRLDEIARHHNGQVPLHGRLFAQWMHHAYPRECPLPHASGTTNPHTPDDWIEAKEMDTVEASMEEIDVHVQMTDGMQHIVLTDVMHWSMEEELVASHHHGFAQAKEIETSLTRPVIFFFAVASAAFGMLRVTSQKGAATLSESKCERHLV